MLDWALDQNEHPVAIRVPAQYVSDGKAVTKDFGELNRYEVTQQGSGVAILALGSVLCTWVWQQREDPGKDRYCTDCYQPVLYHRTGHRTAGTAESRSQGCDYAGGRHSGRRIR